MLSLVLNHLSAPRPQASGQLCHQLVKPLLPSGTSSEAFPQSHCKRRGFSLWVGKIPWRREWQPTSVFLPGEFHGLYSPWRPKELDTTERLSIHFTWLQHGRSEGRVPGTRQEMARLGMKRSVSSRESFGFCPQESEVPASISVQEQQGQTCILGRASGLQVM